MMIASSDDLTSDDARYARIAEIRRQITAGTYETSDKIEAAVDALLVSLNADPRTPPHAEYDPDA